MQIKHSRAGIWSKKCFINYFTQVKVALQLKNQMTKLSLFYACTQLPKVCTIFLANGVIYINIYLYLFFIVIFALISSSAQKKPVQAASQFPARTNFLLEVQ